MSSKCPKPLREKAIICNFGTGGHTEQIKRLLSHIETSNFILIAQSPTDPKDKRFAEYSRIFKVRPDYAKSTAFLAIPFCVIANFIETVRLFIRFDIRLLISTGSGVAIVPSVIARLFRAKVIFFESWSRFTVWRERSISSEPLGTFAHSSLPLPVMIPERSPLS